MEFVLTEFDIVAVARDLAAIARPLWQNRGATPSQSMHRPCCGCALMKDACVRCCSISE